jgi:hypothetical protein
MDAPNDRGDGARRHSRIFTHQSLDQLIDDRLFAQLDHPHRFASRSPSVNAEQAAPGGPISTQERKKMDFEGGGPGWDRTSDGANGDVRRHIDG